MGGGRFEVFDGSAQDWSELSRFYRRMVAEGRWEQVFNRGWVETEDDFYSFVSRDCWFYFGYGSHDEMAGAVWFDTFRPRSCKMHFCSFFNYKRAEFEGILGNLLQIVLDNGGCRCYRVKGECPSRGILRLYRRIGFKACAFDDAGRPESGRDGLYRVELRRENLGELL